MPHARRHTSRKHPRTEEVRNSVTISTGAALTLGAALAASPAGAATFNVTNLNDNGGGSLRQAIVDANGAAGADIIAFQAGLSGTITLTTGQLYIVDSLDIQGPGAASITVSGNNTSRVFYLYNGSALIDVTISGMTITGGSALDGAGIVNIGENLVVEDAIVSGNTATSGEGGGIEVVGYGSGSLTVRNSTISGNAASVGPGGGIALYGVYEPVLIQDSTISGNDAAVFGGGIAFYGVVGGVTIENTTIAGNTALLAGGGLFGLGGEGGAGPLTIRASTISGNDAEVGGGILIAYGVNGEIENSTISGNTASDVGGGIYFYGYYASLEIRHTTVAGNSAATAGGGLAVAVGDVTVSNSIIADNTAPADQDVATGPASTINLDNSLLEVPGAANISDNGGNIFDQDPQLGLLANNGGPTLTHLPALASPAVNAADPAFAPPPAVDQRGFARVSGVRLDMGSVEIQSSVVGITVSAVSVNEVDGTVTLTVTRTGGSDGDITVDFTTSNGSAIEPGDYTLTAGTLSWLNGDATSRSIIVPIVNDTDVEPDEIFTVTLSNASTGASIGTFPAATVTIVSEDAAAPPAPIPSVGFWARLAMMIGVAWAGFWALGRRLFAVMLFSMTVALLAGDVVAEPRKGLEKTEIVTAIESVSKGEGSRGLVRIALADGTTVELSEARLRVADRRAETRRHARLYGAEALESLAKGQVAVVKVRMGRNGEPRRVKVTLFDSVAEATAALSAPRVPRAPVRANY